MNIRRLLLFACFLSGCGLSFRTPLTILIPEGYTGWVRIEFGVPSAPPYATEGGRHVLKVPASGFVQTSSSFEPGYTGDTYVYVTPDGRRTELKQADGAGRSADSNAGVHGPRMFTVDRFMEKPRTFGAFFVGTETAFAKAPRDVSALPLPDK